MSAAEIIGHLNGLSNAERLAVIEAATHLIREGLGKPESGRKRKGGRRKSPLSEVIGCISAEPLPPGTIDRELYGEVML